jgi:hypothetical protein
LEFPFPLVKAAERTVLLIVQIISLDFISVSIFPDYDLIHFFHGLLPLGRPKGSLKVLQDAG